MRESKEQLRKQIETYKITINNYMERERALVELPKILGPALEKVYEAFINVIPPKDAAGDEMGKLIEMGQDALKKYYKLK